MIKKILDKNAEVNPNDREMAVLRENFPSCFRADGTFDIERFQEYLTDKVAISHEGYELKFLGKNYARLLASVDTTTVVVPDEEHNKKPENANSQNIYISGDNLDGLKHLLKSYAHSIKCIYIDPPYNTGSDGFVYNDSFNFTADELVVKLSIEPEQAQRILDLTKRGSASHSAWLIFMYPRLLLARDLLANEGAIFISIDDNEQTNLRLICDDVFGEENLIGQVSVVANPRGRDYGGVAIMHDYLLIYKKSELCHINLVDDPEGEFTCFDELGGFELRELRNRNKKFNKENRPNLYYPFYINESMQDENGLYDIALEPKAGWVEHYPLASQGVNTVWRWGKGKAQQNLNINIKAKKMRNGGYQIVEKYREPKKMARSIWWDKGTNTEKGTLLVKELFDGKTVFDYPKPIELLQKIIQMGTDDDSENIILDFFSGSASMAHATMQYNADKETANYYVMVQLPEAVKKDSEAEKAGYKTIDQIGMERIIRAAKKIKETHPETSADLGFRHYILQEPSSDTLDRLEKFDPIRLDAAENNFLWEFGLPTVLATWLLRDGYGLTSPYEEVDLAGYKAFWKDKHLYLITNDLTRDAISALVDKYVTDGNFNPENVVLFGYSFTWTQREELKANLMRLKDTEKNLRINFDVRY